MDNIIYKGITAGLFLLGLVLWQRSDEKAFLIITAISLCLAGLCCIKYPDWKRRSAFTKTEEIFGMPENSMDEICLALQPVITPLGCGWNGQVRGVPGPAIIYGPDANGRFIYGAYRDTQFYLTAVDDLLQLQSKPKSAPQPAIHDAGNIQLLSLLHASNIQPYARMHTPTRHRNEGVQPAGMTCGILLMQALQQPSYLFWNAEKQLLYTIETNASPAKLSLRAYPSEKQLLYFEKRSCLFLPGYRFYTQENAFMGILKRTHFFGKIMSIELGGERLQITRIKVAEMPVYTMRLGTRLIGTIRKNMTVLPRDHALTVAVFDSEYRTIASGHSSHLYGKEYLATINMPRQVSISSCRGICDGETHKDRSHLTITPMTFPKMLHSSHKGSMVSFSG